MFDAPRRSLRIKAKNLEKIFKAEREHLVAELAECKASLVGELPEVMSQKLQNSKANIDNLNYKQSMLRISFVLCLNEYLVHYVIVDGFSEYSLVIIYMIEKTIRLDKNYIHVG